MVKSLVSKLSSASNLSIASTLSSVGSGGSGVGHSIQKTNYAKHRNDPGRFFGDGVQFKAKLIGILEVAMARGDRMCQDALQDLKMAIRAAGEHKQRITIHVTIDGLRLRDEKTGDSLYHHPVHKISFIAQDMTDSRAFGYIFGNPENGHRFFGIKTDKAASQVVLAMRDLFQVVFELKKKEIELARQQIQSKAIHDHQIASQSSLKSSAASAHNDLGGSGSNSSTIREATVHGSLSGPTGLTRIILETKGAKEMSPESVADLVDLEQELCSIQRGITQMERITPNDPIQPLMGSASTSGSAKAVVGGAGEEDPFGDSFTNFPSYNLLPPPESGRSRHKPNKIAETSGSVGTSAGGSHSNAVTGSLLSPAPAASNSPASSLQQQDEDDSWLHELDQQNDVFDTSKSGVMGLGVGRRRMAPLAPRESSATPTQQLGENAILGDVEMSANSIGAGVVIASSSSSNAAVSSVTISADAASSSPPMTAATAAATLEQLQSSTAATTVKSDAFTDLDPLGIGRTRPYVDKKYFFQELKNPPKKVLKDLSSSSATTSGSAAVGGAADISTSIAVTTAPHSSYTAATASAAVDEFLSKEGLFDDTIAGMESTAGSMATTAATLMTSEHQQLQQQQQSLNAITNTINNTTTGTDPPPSTSASAPTGDLVMLPRDTDPFSPTRKKSDPFQEGGDIFSKLDPFEFEFASSSTATANKSTESNAPARISPLTIIAVTATDARRSEDVFNGPLQVNLPPERGISPPQWKADITRLERQSSESPIALVGNNTASAGAATGAIVPSTVRSRPTPSGQQLSALSTSAASVSAPSSVFKQQTADVLSSISNKKMPHLFGQARFSKRDSNSINMRRLQESDSLSENETAPEPPPRPDSVSHIEPPPLPPKKQFNDIIIRPRVTSGNAVPPAPPPLANSISSSSRYEFLTASAKAVVLARNGDVPPIPLPSRRIGRSDAAYPGPGRPRKPGHTEDDYLAPIGAITGNTTGGSNVQDVPPLLPPPTQSSTRGRAQRQQSLSKAQDIYENKTDILQQQHAMIDDGASAAAAVAAIIPDITLSQLLTLGIDELAVKLNVPMSKLSTMTLVELTSYLSEFIEKSKPGVTSAPPPHMRIASSVSPVPVAADTQSELQSDRSSVFKVSFDQQTTFVAKFDDTFGEDMPAQRQFGGDQEIFVANFAQFNEPPVAAATTSIPSCPSTVPSADRYAVFREIIDLELQHQQQETDLIGDVIPNDEEPRPAASTSPQIEVVYSHEDENSRFEADFDQDDFLGTSRGARQPPPPPQPPRFDTKITEVVAQAKDRYAALRDIILVENLFEKRQTAMPALALDQEKDLMQEFPEFSGDEFNDDQDLKQIMDDRVSNSVPDRIGLVDSRGFPAEPSSSALTVEDDDEEFDEDGGAESSLDSNDKDAEVTGAEQDQYEKLSTSTQQLDVERLEKAETNSIGGHESTSPKSSLMNGKQGSKFLTVAGGGGSGSALSSSKDDLEIDELMQRAISNLSLDSRDRISPANSTNAANTAAVPHPQKAVATAVTLSAQSQFSDMSTSPIPLQKSPVPPASSTLKSPSISKSPQSSPVLSHLSAVSNLIDTATKQMIGSGSNELAAHASRPTSKESWATFDSPKPVAYIAEAGYGGGDKRPRTSAIKAGKGTASLHLPPPPPSNTSQNDTAESPCSSDPRDDGWNKGVGGGGGRRWTKKERHHTSSSSRDLSPWDDETPDYQKQKRIVMPSSAAQMAGTTSHAPSHPDRHGYYMRHARRMNSCDEDYDYEEDFSSNRRDHRKLKQGLSRSRDNFDLDSPSWYHHSTAHNTWSPQDIEQARARSFERSAYERTTYGPPIYDKHGAGVFPVSVASGSYDRRSGGGGGYDKRKYYRNYARPNYDYDEYGESPAAMPERYRETGSFKKLKLGRRSDYENIYDDGRSPMSGERAGVGYKTRSGGGGAVDYMYERDRKSFDRESVESFESATRRRRSFGSGDVYGSLESREDFRDRYIGVGGGPEKTRSLRKGMKMRTAGDIDYEQDSENDFPRQLTSRPSRGGVGVGPVDPRSLQRPNQLAASAGSSGIGSSQTRMRKSSGSSPWDGEEPPLPGQKSWKSRPSSVADSERRLAESRRAAALGQTPSGSDGEKDRRFRKKQRARGKDAGLNNSSGCAPQLPLNSTISGATSGGRYGNPIGGSVGAPNVYLYDDDDIHDIDYEEEEEYDEPPTDEDKFERLNRRRHEMHQRMLESEKRRQHTTATAVAAAVASTALGKQPSATSMKAAIKKYHTRDRDDYDYDDYDDEETPTPRSTASAGPSAGNTPYATDVAASANTKFSFDGGFESDFNQSSSPPPPAPEGTASSCVSTPAATASSNNATPAATAAASTTKSSFRFSNDFSERGERSGVGSVGAPILITVKTLQQHQQLQQQQFDLDATTSPPSQPLATPPITQKLRFDDNVKVSQFDDAAFEDDFSNAQFDFEKEDQWHAESLQATASTAAAKKHNLRNSKLQQRQELIKKSESINIFAKKSEDPFEDDEFFKAPSEAKTSDNGSGGGAGSGGGGGDRENFQWDDDNNFAKFDENM